jgi:hypothetical protein
MAKIYVASSWRNEAQQSLISVLRTAGHEVYDFKNPAPGEHGFSWSEIDELWRSWSISQFIKALKHPISERGFNLDFNGMKWADTCVLLLPCGRSAHTEAGWMKGAGKKVYALIQHHQEPELMYKIFDGIFFEGADLLKQLEEEFEPDYIGPDEKEVSNG